MAKLRKNFTKKEWDDCCRKLCSDCKIAASYLKKYDEKEAKKKMKKDRKKVLKK